MNSYLCESDVEVIAVVASAVAAIASVIVAIIVAASQKKRDKSAQKISLFDKRYKIYCDFLRIYKYAERVKQGAKKELNEKIPNYVEILDELVKDYNFLEGKSYSAEYNYLEHKTNKGGEEGHKADYELYYLDKKVQDQLTSLKTTLVSEVQMSEFCYNSDLCSYLRSFITEFINYVSVFKDGSALRSERDATDLLESVRQINEHKIIDKMKKELLIK